MVKHRNMYKLPKFANGDPVVTNADCYLNIAQEYDRLNPVQKYEFDNHPRMRPVITLAKEVQRLIVSGEMDKYTVDNHLLDHIVKDISFN